MESVRPDLNGVACCVGDCFEVADALGTADVRLPPAVGAVEEDELLRLTLPLCAKHAHLLRMGVSSCELSGWGA